MHRSSSSIGGLAAALAKAQAELVNPEKSLVGSIYSDHPGGAERIFRYAPLSAGLDIVRKALGQHEIAVVQTTGIDQTADIVSLTTVLAHSSGEWIASDWPVCAISETATPHRMGAALTYARRYALFTLVGIAGEDDLDAPDLLTPTSRAPGPDKSQGSANDRGNGGGQRRPARRQAPIRRDAKVPANYAELILGAEASRALRDHLVAELDALSSADAAAIWAKRRLIDKNRLTLSDARLVEEAFQAKLASVAGDPADEHATLDRPRRRRQLCLGVAPKRPRSTGVDKSTLPLPEPRRIRDRDHVRFVANQPCVICGRQPSDAHHVRFAQSPALGRKVSDEFTVPLCRGHHREVHRCGDEPVWWLKMRINPMTPARALWLKTHPLPNAESVEGVGELGSDRERTEHPVAAPVAR
jgi:hypothetical protein